MHRVGELKLLGNRNLLFDLFCSDKIEKYFLSDTLYVNYDEGIHKVSKSILYIPIISSIITIARAIRADVYVKELDGTFGIFKQDKTGYEEMVSRTFFFY